MQEATCSMQIASPQAANVGLSQLPEMRSRGRNWALSPVNQTDVNSISLMDDDE